MGKSLSGFIKDNKKLMLPLFIMAAIIALTIEWICLPEEAYYINESAGNDISLYKNDRSSAVTEGYDMDGNSFVVTGDDPHISFQNLNTFAKSVWIKFSEPLKEDTFIQFYYSDSEHDFKEATSIIQITPKGKKSCYINFPDYYFLNDIRVDIQGNFELDEIIIFNGIAREHFKKSAADPIRIFFVFLFTAVALYACVFFIPGSVQRGNTLIKQGFKGFLKGIYPSYIIIFVFLFMLFIYEPIIMYTTNTKDFWFDLQTLIMPLIKVFLMIFLPCIAIVSAVYFVCLLFTEKRRPYYIAVLCGTTAFFGAYLEGSWLSGSLPGLNGENILWDQIGIKEDIILFIILSVFIISIITMSVKLGIEKMVRYAGAGSGAVFIMLIFALVPTATTEDAMQSKISYSTTSEGNFTPSWKNFSSASSQTNFFILCVDCTDSSLFNTVLNGNEQFNGMFDDFTYYTDAMCGHLQTRNSIPQILTGVLDRNQSSYIAYSNSSYNNSPLFKKLAENNYQINLYSPMVYWSGRKTYNIANDIGSYKPEINLSNFAKNEIKYILFKYLPYSVKKYSKIQTMTFNDCQIINNTSIFSTTNYRNRPVYEAITSNPTLELGTDNYFQFFHFEGSHPPYDIDINMKSISGEGTYDQKIGAALTITKAYLDRIKESGIYDNSVIVVMADHGHYGDESMLDGYTEDDYQYYLTRNNPILLIKGINEHHKMNISDKPVSFDDLMNAFTALIDGSRSDELFPEAVPGRERRIMVFDWKDEKNMDEYVTNGTTREIDKFRFNEHLYCEYK